MGTLAEGVTRLLCKWGAESRWDAGNSPPAVKQGNYELTHPSITNLIIFQTKYKKTREITSEFTGWSELGPGRCGGGVGPALAAVAQRVEEHGEGGRGRVPVHSSAASVLEPWPLTHPAVCSPLGARPPHTNCFRTHLIGPEHSHWR